VLHPANVELELVPKPDHEDIVKAVYEIISENGCAKTTEIRSILRSQNIMIGERKLRQILNYFIYMKKAYYDLRGRAYCANGSKR